MNLTLARESTGTDGVFGVLMDDADGGVLAQTLEHAYGLGEAGWGAKIPSGLYWCRRGSHRLPGMAADFETFEITDVPGHSGLLFHWGNFDRDSEGCVLLGLAVIGSGAGRMITSSRVAFSAFLEHCDGIDSFTLSVVDP